jgi:hypothetical protein
LEQLLDDGKYYIAFSYKGDLEPALLLSHSPGAFVYLFFGNTWVSAQGLMLHRQELYHLSHAAVFALVIFQRGSPSFT